MDRNAPPAIIKSGARHSVQVAAGTTNAKSVRNVVTSDVDAPIEERIINLPPEPERETAVLQKGLEEERQITERLAFGEEAQTQERSVTLSLDPDPSPNHAHHELAPELPAGGAASAGPVIVQHVLADQDAFAAKVQPETEPDVFVQEAPTATAADQMVSEHATAMPDNRQRIEQIQAEADRIRLDQAAPSSTHRIKIDPASPVRKRHDVPEADAMPAGAAEDAAQEGARAAAAADEAALPPEVAANLGQRTVAPAQTRESDLMARLRAIKSHMSVTENRLTQLHQPEPPKS